MTRRFMAFFGGAKIYQLEGPGIDIKTRITLNGESVNKEGYWKGKAKKLPVNEGEISTDINSASASLIIL